jgi:serine/threonine protein kinase
MPPANWWVVLADFGISKRAGREDNLTTMIRGTIEFMAPELMGFLDTAKPKHISDFKASDMWALGEIAFQMLTGEPTFQTPRQLMEYCLGTRVFPLSRLRSTVGDDGEAFISNLMVLGPHDRIDSSEALDHRWMQPQRVDLENNVNDFTFEDSDAPESLHSKDDRRASNSWSNLSSFAGDTSNWPIMQTTDTTSSITLERNMVDLMTDPGFGAFVTFSPNVNEIIERIVSELRESVALMAIIRQQHESSGQPRHLLNMENIVQTAMQIAAEEIAFAYNKINEYNNLGYHTKDSKNFFWQV